MAEEKKNIVEGETGGVPISTAQAIGSAPSYPHVSMFKGKPLSTPQDLAKDWKAPAWLEKPEQFRINPNIRRR